MENKKAQRTTPHIVHCRHGALSKVSSLWFLLFTRISKRSEPGNEPYPKTLGAITMNALLTITIIFLSVFNTDILCQVDDQKNGAYRNHLDFYNNRPFAEFNFKLIKKDNLRVPKLYQVISKDGSVKIKTIKKSIWGIYYNGLFYLNAEKLGMINGYIKFDSLSKYCYFKGIPIMTLGQEERLNRSARNHGLTGAAVTGTKIALENKENVHYVLNTQTGMINLLTKEYLLRILETYDELLLYFDFEENNGSIEVLLKYLDLVNKMK